MAKYIKNEMPDLNGIGKTGAYYRMETYRNIGAERFIDKCAKRGGDCNAVRLGNHTGVL